MNILAIGDVVGSIGCEHLRSKLPTLKKLKNIDMVICNGENSADGNGITPASADHLFDSGVDVITLGNHSFRRREIYDYLDENENIIRPLNFPEDTTPGKGVCIYDMGYTQVAVINLMGTVFLESLKCPFDMIDELLKSDRLPRIKIIDFHAEATGEKRAFGFFVDGKVSAVFGTHTHVQTADEEILPKGTGYMTDAGMTGPIESALGIRPEIAIKKFRTKMPVRFENQKGACKMDCVLFDIDKDTGMCKSVERFSIR